MTEGRRGKKGGEEGEWGARGMRRCLLWEGVGEKKGVARERGGLKLGTGNDSGDGIGLGVVWNAIDGRRLRDGIWGAEQRREPRLRA